MFPLGSVTYKRRKLPLRYPKGTIERTNPNSGSLHLRKLAPDRYEMVIPPVENSANSGYQHEEVTIRFVK